MPVTSEEPDIDAAYAWLEGLAVRQGAEEALLLTPEERQEEPPEWVKIEAESVEAVAPETPVGAAMETSAEVCRNGCCTGDGGN